MLIHGSVRPALRFAAIACVIAGISGLGLSGAGAAEPGKDAEKTNQAIVRGIKYLKSAGIRMVPLDKHADGGKALCGWTLLECDLAANDESVTAIAKLLRKRAPKMTMTYSIALTLLFLHRLGDPPDASLIQSLALRLVAGQTTSGTWTYDCPLLTAEDEKKFLVVLKILGGENVKEKLAEAEPKVGRAGALALVKRLSEPAPKILLGDNSNTQFALMALWVARRHDLPIAPALKLAERHFRDTQNADGSWGYSQNRRQWPASMTCAGLLGVAIGHGLAKGPADKQEKDPVIEKAFTFLGETVAAPPNSRVGGRLVHADAHDDLYYLWSLERVAMVFDLATIGGKDWYAWASTAILGAQRPNGSWDENIAPPIDTCFALLVLKRVNVVKDLTGEVKKAVRIKE